MSNNYTSPHEYSTRPRPEAERQLIVNTSTPYLLRALLQANPGLARELEAYNQPIPTRANQISSAAISASQNVEPVIPTAANTAEPATENFLAPTEPTEGSNEAYLQQLRQEIQEME